MTITNSTPRSIQQRDHRITAGVETITPEIAEAMLLGNIVNRQLRQGRVDLYAKYMSTDAWRVTGESIVFSPTGQLLQGQHRLSACVQAGAPFRTVVVRGVDPEAMKVMDSGMSRTAGDTFRLEGVSNSSGQAATVKQLVALENGWQRDTNRTALITRDELLDFHANHTDRLQEAWAISQATGSALRHSRAGWATLAFVLLEADRELAVEFFSAMSTGAGLPEGDARLAFRSHILNCTSQRRKLHWTELVANGIRVWNSWLDGKTVNHIKGWRPAHSWPEVAA